MPESSEMDPNPVRARRDERVNVSSLSLACWVCGMWVGACRESRRFAENATRYATVGMQTQL
jgi:hypothetical protein